MKVVLFLKQIFNKIKVALPKAKSFFMKYKYILFMSLPFVVMDLFTRFFSYKVNFFGVFRLAPNLFSLIWISLFVGVSLLYKKSIGKWLYLSTNIIFTIFFLINNIYYSMTSNFFHFTLFESTGEGLPYILDALKNCNILVYIFFIVIVALIVFGIKSIPKKEITETKSILKLVIILTVAYIVAPLSLGFANADLVWSTWKNPRNVYDSFNDSNKSMRVAGLFEYTIRGFYVNYLKPEETDENDLLFLEEVYSVEDTKSSNKYTGKYKGKNLIFVQLEGVDNWTITKENTPTLFNMMNNSINFTNHYSFYTGGGSTFNSEFSVNTGFIGPLSYNKNVYTFNNNDFPYSMGNLFKEQGYVINAFHMNTGEYYSRSINYKNWGYDNYYGLIDMYKYKNEEYKLDRELILNEEFSRLMFPTDTSFVDYIITYSPHLPFTNTKGVCKQLYDLDNEGKEVLEEVLMSEEECVRRQVKETDYFMELLLKKLKEQSLLNNTVIVVFSDHYLYTLEDQTILDKYKNTSNNLINKTPFFIWSSDLKSTKVNKVTSQLNILPTVLDLFGMDYNSNYYIGSNALANNYSGLVFFGDYSWYNGTVYVDGGEVTNNKKISQEQLEKSNYLINYLAKKNDLTLKYNYFKKIKK